MDLGFTDFRLTQRSSRSFTYVTQERRPRAQILGDGGFNSVCQLAVRKARKVRQLEAIAAHDLHPVAQGHDRGPEDAGESARRALPISAKSFSGRALDPGAPGAR